MLHTRRAGAGLSVLFGGQARLGQARFQRGMVAASLMQRVRQTVAFLGQFRQASGLHIQPCLDLAHPHLGLMGADARLGGLILGLEFDHPEGAVAVSRALYEGGVWAIFSSLDKRVLQFKPGVLLDAATSQEIIDRVDAAMPRARELLRSPRRAA